MLHVTSSRPHSHALIKAPGGTVSAGWALTNSGADPATVEYSLWRMSPIVRRLATGPLINIPPGQTINVFHAVTWLVPNEPGIAMVALIIDQVFAAEALVASHNFTVDIR